MHAIVEISGKQFKVSEGDVIFAPRMEGLEEGSSVEFDKVLMISDEGKVTIGKDVIKGAKVKATVISHGKEKKVLVFKYKAKKNIRKTKGHRQPYTRLQIEKITKRATKKQTEKKEVTKKEAK